MKHSQSVIIVEDDVDIAERLAQLIQSDDGLKLLALCTNVFESIKALIAYKPDILLTDLLA